MVSPTSDRLQLLEPFPAWDGNDYLDLPVLMKAQGKCTTDHISAAGPWLKYRGHLENISGNLFLGAVNAFTGEAGTGIDSIDGETTPVPRDRQALPRGRHRAGCAIGDRNYGEGSSREHAAMEPRFRNGVVILARSFARIHETNLKKQGLLPLTFADPATYDEIGEDDRINVLGLPPVPGRAVRCQIVKPDGTDDRLRGRHTFSDEQVEWFRGRVGAQHRPPQGRGRREPIDAGIPSHAWICARRSGPPGRCASSVTNRSPTCRGRSDARRRPLRTVGRQPPTVAGGARRRTPLLRRQLAP